MYNVKFAEEMFILTCIQKKSKRSVTTPMEDMDIINARLKITEAYVSGAL